MSLDLDRHKKIKRIRHIRSRILGVSKLVSQGGVPDEWDMAVMSSDISKLETYTFMDSDILRATKIHMTLEAFIRLENIPQEVGFRFISLCRALLSGYKDILDRDMATDTPATTTPGTTPAANIPATTTPATTTPATNTPATTTPGSTKDTTEETVAQSSGCPSPGAPEPAESWIWVDEDLSQRDPSRPIAPNRPINRHPAYEAGCEVLPRVLQADSTRDGFEFVCVGDRDVKSSSGRRRNWAFGWVCKRLMGQ